MKVLVILWRTVSWLIVAAAAAVLVLLLFGVRPYAVKTGSMAPAIPAGSLCFVNQRYPFQDLQEGDVIAYRLGDMLVTHRVIRIDPDGLITKGDANNTEDTAAKVTRENYVGKTLFSLPWVGELMLFLRTTPGKLAAAALVLLFLTIGFLSDRLTAPAEETETTP